MNLTKWNTPRTFYYDELFDQAINGLQRKGIERTPSANIMESDDNFKLDLAVPGMKKEDFKITLDKNILTIACEVEDNNNEAAENYTRKEFSVSSFSRSFTLPKSVAADQINAEFKDGILHLNLPKKEEEKVKLTIAVG